MAFVMAMAGCATTTPTPGGTGGTGGGAGSGTAFTNPKDPWEPMNRRIYAAGTPEGSGALPQLAVFTAEGAPLWSAELSAAPVSEPAPAAEALTRLFEAHCGRIFHHSLLDEL